MPERLRNKILQFYELSKGSSFLHEWFRQQILAMEIPLIKLFLRLASPSSPPRIEVRHSLLEPDGFNIFMSDVDLTLIIDSPTQAERLLRIYSQAKIIFKNLGEPEILSQHEMQILLNHETTTNKELWSKIFQLRKLHWQNIKYTATDCEYEKAKVVRGINKSKQKLSSKNQLKLDNFFPDCPESHELPTYTFPYYSKYLERWIEITPSMEDSLICPSLAKANGFLKILPGTEAEDEFMKCQSKRYLTIREICLTISQLRILKDQKKDFQHLVDWIKKLEQQVGLELYIE